MPYKRNYRKKPYNKNRRRRNPYYRKPARYRVADAAYNGYKLARRLARMVNVEYKLARTDLTQSITYAGAFSTLNAPALGDSDTTRDGDSIRCQNLTIRGRYEIGAAATITQIRMIVFWDQSVKAGAVSDILASSYLSTVNAPNAPKAYDKRFQTKFLLDKTIVLDTSKAKSVPFKYVIPINKHTQFNAGTTTQNSGRLAILFVSNEATQYPSVIGVAQLSYTDN